MLKIALSAAMAVAFVLPAQAESLKIEKDGSFTISTSKAVEWNLNEPKQFFLIGRKHRTVIQLRGYKGHGGVKISKESTQ